MARAGTRQLRSQGPASGHAHRTEGVTRSERREGTNGVGGEIDVGGGNGDGEGNRDVNGDRDGDEVGTITGVEVNEGAQDGNEAGVGTG